MRTKQELDRAISTIERTIGTAPNPFQMNVTELEAFKQLCIRFDMLNWMNGDRNLFEEHLNFLEEALTKFGIMRE